jgi:hypothetical protein
MTSGCVLKDHNKNFIFLPGPAIPAALAFSASHISHAKENFVMPGVALRGCSAGRASYIHLPSTLLPRFPYEGQPLTEGPLTRKDLKC